MEQKVGLIPYVLVPGAFGQKEYGVLLTNERTIFVLEKSANTAAGAVIGGVVGAMLAYSMTSKRTVDYAVADPEALAREEENIVVPHSRITGFRLRKSMAVYVLEIEYANAEGKTKKVQAWVTPPQEMIKARKAQGAKLKETTVEYVKTAEEALKRALPTSLAQRVNWPF